MSKSKMEKAYCPNQVEERRYQEWENRGLFHGNASSVKDAYTIVIPPPNVTGMLTLGHVLNNTLQDILIRWEKMRGKEVCWVPGTDHAGIATQSKVEAYLRETESLTRFDLGREQFLKRVWKWKEQYGGVIIRQLRRLGVACDWRRERFTLDSGLSETVTDVFIRLYRKGLVYKGRRMINWCPKSRTALSDEEVIYRNCKDSLWYIRYPLTGSDDHVVVATTRPETMLGDTGVAVHPADQRYQRLIGRRITLPLTNREIPIFGDEYVDKEFGTGAVKVTPAHDPNDYEMGIRHHLGVVDVMNDDGSMNDLAGAAFSGMDRYDCRKQVVDMLGDQGLIEKIEDYEHQVGFSERGHVAVEPRLSEQWFVSMKTLAEPALRAVNDGRIRFYPDRWVKTYNHWMENIKDWCISRQLWWGHRIPAYYCENCGEITVAAALPKLCDHCQTVDFKQDLDVLDTWFSSWLWPFSVFDWPNANDDLDRFYPTQSLVTAPDIIFFWVARMIMAGLEFMGDVPFQHVYFTSIIRDSMGRKLSKSLNNSPNPLDVIDEYGADALRYTIIYIAPIGQDIRYSNEKCEIGRNFANKIWNAARFREMQGEISVNWDRIDDLEPDQPRADDRWILIRLDRTLQDITSQLSEFHFHAYAIDLYEFIWNEFCDWYVESAKSVFYGEDKRKKETVARVFDYVFASILRIMHPVMPFITEELFHALGFVDDRGSIMEATWPTPLANEVVHRLGLNAEIEMLVSEKFQLIKSGRNLRGSYNIPYNQKIRYVIKPTDKRFGQLVESDLQSVAGLLNAETVTVEPDHDHAGAAPSAVGRFGLIFMPLEGVVDISAEIQRLSKQKADLEALLNQIQAKLANRNFVTRAPEDVVEKEKRRRVEFQEKLTQVESLLAVLK